jgi:hypothetical protein
LGLAGGLFLMTRTARAGPALQASGNDACLACHGQPGGVLTFENGEQVSLSVDREAFDASVHGQEGFACVLCHTDIGDYPHAPLTATTRRDFNVQLYQACRPCHQVEYERTLDSVHERARAAGMAEAAICTDCHGAHDIRRMTDPDRGAILPEARTWVAGTCARCHSAIYEKYSNSVHGSALIGQGNLDVPTCIDCHGVHNIEDPTTAAFRLRSPLICAGCHTDPARMAPYGLSTDVLNTYVADFHGTTVTLFERLTPDAETNKPVCYDCHGVHDIRSVRDPEQGLRVRENLLARCQRCHPGATANFPDAWLSHYIPSPDRAPLVYTVNLFYMILIPGVLGGMALLVALDLGGRLRRSLRQKTAGPARPAEAAAPPASEAPSPPASPQATQPPAALAPEPATSSTTSPPAPAVPPSTDVPPPAPGADLADSAHGVDDEENGNG